MRKFFFPHTTADMGFARLFCTNPDLVIPNITRPLKTNANAMSKKKKKTINEKLI